jgi:hypothetical protein
MDRRHTPLLLPRVFVLVPVFLLAACGSGGSSSASTAVTLAPAGSAAPSSSGGPVVTAPPPSLPSDVDPGTGSIVVGDVLIRFGITECTFVPSADPDTGVVTTILLAGDDGNGGAISISQRQTSSGGSTTVTETMQVTRAGSTLEAVRFAVGGTYRDLRDPTANGALLIVDTSNREVRASGTLGPPGSVAGAAGLVPGSVIARCD